MATKLQKRIEQMESRTRSSRARIRTEAMRREEAFISVGAAGILGELKRRKTDLPTFGGMEPALLYGALLVAGGPMIASGKTSQRIQAAGSGLLAAAAYNYGRNRSLTLAGDDGYEDDGDDDDVVI